MGHNKQERKRKEKEILVKEEKKRRTKISKQRRIRGDDVHDVGGDNDVQEARIFSRLLCLFFSSQVLLRRAMLQLEFGES